MHWLFPTMAIQADGCVLVLRVHGIYSVDRGRSECHADCCVSEPTFVRSARRHTLRAFHR